jgi:hypothetical protein
MLTTNEILIQDTAADLFYDRLFAFADCFPSICANKSTSLHR